MPAAEAIDHVINKIEQLVNQHPCTHFLLFSEVNQPSIYSIPACAPFIFIDQCPAVLNEIQVLRMKFVDLRTHRLEQSCNGDCLRNCHGHIAYSELNSIVKRMHAQ